MQLCPNGRWAYPVVFLTNGGGVSESYKAEQLSQWLDVPVSGEGL
jgi:ribonucleotide monophosphatase NagD (HAD superfamily)